MSTAATVPEARASGDVPSGRAWPELVAHQIRYEQLSFWRNPQSAVFTFVLPVAIIVVFGLVFGGVKATSYFDNRTPLEYYIPTIAAVSVLGACYSQLAVVLAMRRQQGILKRLRATPLPAWVYFTGLVAHCVMISVVQVALIIGLGRLYGAPLPSGWGALVITLVLGAAAFCTLGVAVASLITNADAAPAVVQFILFPLIFISGTYFPIHSQVLNSIAGALPLRPFNQALTDSFSAHPQIGGGHLAVLLAWGVVGAFIAVRRFRWEPHTKY